MNTPDYYDKLGVTKIINAAGTFTLLSSSLMPEPVQAAIAQAAKHPVRIIELQQAAGAYLAQRLHCEAALVTSGASSALTLATAACRKGPHSEVIIQRAHRADYDYSLALCGIQFVEVESIDEYESAFTPRTAMTHFFHAAEAGTITAADWLRIAHQHTVPCLIDAAADIPPISNLWNLTEMGFDLVAFSGGKGICGPQNTGLLLGRRHLIEAAFKNASPFDGTVGRGMKVAKEQIIGLVAAVDWFLTQSDEQIEKQCRDRAELIADTLKHLPSMRTSIVIPPVANHVPHLLLHYDRTRIQIDPLSVATLLREGSPSIELHPDTGGNTIVVGTWTLQPGQESPVAQRLLEVLTKAIHEP